MSAFLSKFIPPQILEILRKADAQFVKTMGVLFDGSDREELVMNIAFFTLLVLGIYTLMHAMGMMGDAPKEKEKELAPALDPDSWIQLPLAKKEVINHNTRLFRFKLKDPNQPLGLPIGQHISIKAIDEKGNGLSDDKGPLIKPYTPTSTHTTRGHVDFVIKVYENGRLSKFMDKLQVGDVMAFKGPKGHFQYKQNMKRNIGMVCGGTGITPMFQVLQAILNDPQDRTKIKLIYANVTEEDILLRKELDAFATVHKNQLEIYYVLDKPPAGWTGGQGFVTKEMLQQHMFPAAEDTMVLRCGPPPMVRSVEAALQDLGFTKETLFEF